MNGQRKWYRLSLLQLLLLLGVCGVVANTLRPPQISFGPERITHFPEMGTFWGPVPITIIARVPITNEGIMPISYRHADPDGFAVGELARSSEILSNSGMDVDWHSLGRGETVELRVYGLMENDQVRFRLQDWLGREFEMICSQVDMKQIWQQRESLPMEIPDREATESVD